jgi:hypothetical protein
VEDLVMATASFELHVFADHDGRTMVRLVDPASKSHTPVVLTFVAERALYDLMQHVRPEVRPLEVLDNWGPAETDEACLERLLAEATETKQWLHFGRALNKRERALLEQHLADQEAATPLDPADIEEAIEKCGF